MNEDFEEMLLSKLKIVVVIIIAVIVIIIITMMDFSKEEKIADASNVNNRNILKRNVISVVVNDSEDEEESEINNEVESSYIQEQQKNQILNVMKGDILVVTEDRITGSYEDSYSKITNYYQFDENQMLMGIYAEIYCKDENMIDVIYKEFSDKKITRSGNTLYLDYGYSNLVKNMTKAEVEASLSRNYTLVYE